MPRYAFLGPAGTFSEEALLSLGIDDLDPYPCVSIDEVFEAVERGQADGGVVPIENSVEGSVPATLDALAFETSLEIQGELVVDIHHALILAPGADLAGVPPSSRILRPPGSAVGGSRAISPGAPCSPRTRPPRQCSARSAIRPSRQSAPDWPPSCTAARSSSRRSRTMRATRRASWSSAAGLRSAHRRRQDLTRAVPEGGQARCAADDPVGVRLRRDQPDQDPVTAHETRARATTCSSSISKGMWKTSTSAPRWTACG